MNPDYRLHDTSTVFSPGLLFYKDLIRRNIARMIEIAGGPQKLRPHVKTHKTREIVRMELEAGIDKHKCATIAEAEMAANCGVPDVLLSYNLVGPNCDRLVGLIKRFPRCKFSVLADHPRGAAALSQALARAGEKVEVLIDLDVGQHRTGIAPGSDAVALYESLARLPGLSPGGLHVYDGHNHQENLAERTTAVKQQLDSVLGLKAALEKKSLPVPRLVLGGTPSFPIHARINVPGAEFAPGTCVLHDMGYGTRFADLTGFTSAALLLTRVISRPTPQRVTFDLGYKAIASDPPAGKRLTLLDVPDYEAVLQNEEHLVIETPAADRFTPGDVAYAIPTHVCPTSAMHKFAYVVESGNVVDRWEIVGRDRMLTV
jgi:D-serine deaminase-like pyridoxal phosphate-dependent protein